MPAKRAYLEVRCLERWWKTGGVVSEMKEWSGSHPSHPRSIVSSVDVATAFLRRDSLSSSGGDREGGGVGGAKGNVGRKGACQYTETNT